MPTIPPDRLEDLAARIFAALGASDADARWVATLLVRANLRGHDSHGVIRIPQYVTSVRKGETNLRPAMRILSETPTTAVVVAALLGALFVLASRVLTVSPILYALRRGNRASVLPALNLSQVSEFSLVIGALGVGLGHIGSEELGTIVYMMIITALGSTYLIQYNDQVFRAINPSLERIGLVERLASGRRASSGSLESPLRSLVLVGFWRHASSLLFELLSRDAALARLIRVIDFNPEVKDELDRRGITNSYGDVSHVATLEHAHVDEGRVLVCTLPDSILKGTTNLKLLRQLKALVPGARVIMTAERLPAAVELYREGAAFVYVPRLTSVRELAEIVIHALDADPVAAREVAERDLAARSEVLP